MKNDEELRMKNWGWRWRIEDVNNNEDPQKLFVISKLERAFWCATPGINQLQIKEEMLESGNFINIGTKLNSISVTNTYNNNEGPTHRKHYV